MPRATSRKTRALPAPVPTPELLALVARRFRVLADPVRLRILHAFGDEELTVGQVIERTELPQATVSKHLQVLHAAGFLSRRKDGLFAYYELADEDVLRLCQMVCGRLANEAAEVRKLFTIR